MLLTRVVAFNQENCNLTLMCHSYTWKVFSLNHCDLVDTDLVTLCFSRPITHGICLGVVIHSLIQPNHLLPYTSSFFMTIIIIIIIAFQGAIRDFLQSPHSAANCLQHVSSSGPGATVCKSRATRRALITCKCHATCHLVRRDSSAIKFDRIIAHNYLPLHTNLHTSHTHTYLQNDNLKSNV